MSRHSITNPAQRIELTDRQEDVLRLIARGLTNAEIADRLGVTLDGVKWHVREILGKFGVDSREEAAERWKQQRARRASSWLRAFATGSGIRWAGGAAAVSSGVVLGAAIAYSLADDDQHREPKISVAQAEERLPLTLDISGLQLDGTELQLGLWLHGRPELGRILAPIDPSSVVITDEFGNVYTTRSVARDMVNTRGLTVKADPPLVSATRLHVTFRGPSFLSLEDEMDSPGRTVPSVTLAAEWTVAVPNLLRAASSFAAVDTSPRAFGPVVVVLESARQDASATTVTLRVVDMPESLQLAYTPDVELMDSGGRSLAPLHGSWGNGLKHDEMEFRFAKTTGPVTLTLRGVPRQLVSRADIPAMVASGSTNQGAEQLEAFADQMALAKDQLTVSFAGQQLPSWTFSLP